jgi:hypothetical protein
MLWARNITAQATAGKSTNITSIPARGIIIISGSTRAAASAVFTAADILLIDWKAAYD